jgi:hypothetical protein
MRFKTIWSNVCVVKTNRPRRAHLATVQFISGSVAWKRTIQLSNFMTARVWPVGYMSTRRKKCKRDGAHRRAVPPQGPGMVSGRVNDRPQRIGDRVGNCSATGSVAREGIKTATTTPLILFLLFAALLLSLPAAGGNGKVLGKNRKSNGVTVQAVGLHGKHKVERVMTVICVVQKCIKFYLCSSLTLQKSHNGSSLILVLVWLDWLLIFPLAYCRRGRSSSNLRAVDFENIIIGLGTAQHPFPQSFNNNQQLLAHSNARALCCAT